MTDILAAINALKEKGIEAFDVSNMLVIPVSNPEDIYPTVGKVRRIFKEIDYQKSWRIDPYYYAKHDGFDQESCKNLTV